MTELQIRSNVSLLMIEWGCVCIYVLFFATLSAFLFYLSTIFLCLFLHFCVLYFPVRLYEAARDIFLSVYIYIYTYFWTLLPVTSSIASTFIHVYFSVTLSLIMCKPVIVLPTPFLSSFVPLKRLFGYENETTRKREIDPLTKDKRKGNVSCPFWTELSILALHATLSQLARL